MTRVDCQQEDDWAMLLIELHNYNTQQTVRLLAEKGGGDAMRLQPPADPALLPMIGITCIKGMPSLRFSCQTLKVCQHGHELCNGKSVVAGAQVDSVERAAARARQMCTHLHFR